MDNELTTRSAFATNTKL